MKNAKNLSLRRSVAACAHIDDADGEQVSMTLTVTRIRFQMIHQFLKITSAPQSARSSHEITNPKERQNRP